MKTFFYLCLFSFSLQVYADDLNKRTNLSPSVRVKINKYIARIYIQKKKGETQANKTLNTTRKYGSSGNNQAINNVSNVRYAPKELITAVRGDIINICFHCR